MQLVQFSDNKFRNVNICCSNKMNDIFIFSFLHVQHVSAAFPYMFLQRPNKIKALLEMGHPCDFLCRCGIRAEGWA